MIQDWSESYSRLRPVVNIFFRFTVGRPHFPLAEDSWWIIM